MRFEYLIGLRYLRARRKERFVSLIAIISLAGVILGTFTLTVVLSVMSGVEQDLRQRLLAFTPHITIERQPDAPPSASLDTLNTQLGSLGGVSGIAPYVSSQVLVAASSGAGGGGYVSGGMMRGVVARNNPVLVELNRSLVAGSLDTLGQKKAVIIHDRGTDREVELPQVIIGQNLADDLGVKLGDPLTIISPTSFGAVAAVPRLRRFAVGGFFHSGMAEYDASLMFVPLSDAATLLADDSQIERGLEVRVRNVLDAPALARHIERVAGAGFEVKDWTQTNASLFAALKLETLTYFLVLLLIVLVAAFNIISTLVMVVMERRKEIAILQAMGARARSIAAIFVFDGAALGVVGTVLGVGFGYLTSFLIGHYHLIHLPPEFPFEYAPVEIKAANFVVVGAAAVVLCALAALYPAMKARLLRPVEVIRYE